MEELEELKNRLEQQRPAPWEALPDLNLYMDQVIGYMPRQLIRYGEEEWLTSAMVNNYIKDGLLPRAEGKRYSRTHLAYLTAICALKQVLPVKDAGMLVGEHTGEGAQAMYARLLPPPPGDWTRPWGRRSCPPWPWSWLCAATPTSWPASGCWT